MHHVIRPPYMHPWTSHAGGLQRPSHVCMLFPESPREPVCTPTIPPRKVFVRTYVVFVELPQFSPKQSTFGRTKGKKANGSIWFLDHSLRQRQPRLQTSELSTSCLPLQVPEGRLWKSQQYPLLVTFLSPILISVEQKGPLSPLFA